VLKNVQAIIQQIMPFDCHLQHFLEFGDIFGFEQYLWLTSNIFQSKVNSRIWLAP